MGKGEDSSTELAVVDDPEQLAMVLAGMADVPFEDPSAVQLAIVRRILSAKDAAEAMAETPTYSTQDLIGETIEVLDCRVFKSRYDGQGGFLACDALRLKTGERCIVNSSAAKVAARIAWHWQHDALPARFTITELEGETASGYKVLDVQAAA